ncbi:hypothetical protein V8D89_006438 [Ganoderma adspersum]
MTDPKPKPTSGAMMSKVGNPQVYEDGDQRHARAGEHNQPPQHEKPELLAGGQMDAHILDPRDDRGVRIREKQERKEEREAEKAERHKTVTNPLAPALMHGHKPSRGAQVDAQLQHEDEEELLAKGPYYGMCHNGKHKHEHGSS